MVVYILTHHGTTGAWLSVPGVFAHPPGPPRSQSPIFPCSGAPVPVLWAPWVEAVAREGAWLGRAGLGFLQVEGARQRSRNGMLGCDSAARAESALPGPLHHTEGRAASFLERSHGNPEPPSVWPCFPGRRLLVATQADYTSCTRREGPPPCAPSGPRGATVVRVSPAGLYRMWPVWAYSQVVHVAHVGSSQGTGLVVGCVFLTQGAQQRAQTRPLETAQGCPTCCAGCLESLEHCFPQA